MTLSDCEIPETRRGLALGQVDDCTHPHDQVHGNNDEPKKGLLPLLGDGSQQRDSKRGLGKNASYDGNELADVYQLKSRSEVLRFNVLDMFANTERHRRRDASGVYEQQTLFV